MEQETTHAIPKFYPNPRETGLRIKPQRVPKRKTQVFRFFVFCLQESLPVTEHKGSRQDNLPSSGIPHSFSYNNKKADNSFELSAVVAGGGLEPPTFGL